MRKVLLLIWGCLCLAHVLKAQDDEDAACDRTSQVKKAAKLLEKAKDRKKYEFDERYRFYMEASQLDPECTECFFRLGKFSYLKVKESGASFNKAKQYYKKTIELCPNYHAEPYYYLGVFAYSDGSYEEAVDYWTKFLDFEAEEKWRTPRDYDKKYTELEEAIPVAKFFKDFYGSPVPFRPKKIDQVSTPEDEYLPMISPDNAMLFYTRKKFIKKKGDLKGVHEEQLTVSQRIMPDDENIKKLMFDGGKALRGYFKAFNNYGGVTLSLDNSEMFFTGCKKMENGYNNCDIYRSEFAGGNWTEPENLGTAVNSEVGWEAQPSLTSDGKTLYFAAIKDERNICNIYETHRQGDGSWSEAKEVEAITTGMSEKSPFIHSDSKTLYFASNGRLGAGGYDIYFSKQNEKGEWSEPINIGHPINTDKDEHGLIVSADGRKAFFGSNRMKGATSLDVYSFSLYKAARPKEIKIVKGQVKEGTEIKIKYAESGEEKKVELKEDGSYATVVELREKDHAVMTVKKKGYSFASKVFTLDDTLTATAEKVDLAVERIEVGKPYTITDLLYDTKASSIQLSSKSILAEFAAYLNENKTLRLAIHGHTDNVGKSADNKELSERRAEEVKKFLVDQGVKSSRLVAKGYGESKPVASNETEEGRAKNRRTEFVILSK